MIVIIGCIQRGGGKDRVRQGSGVEDGEREGFEGQDIFL